MARGNDANFDLSPKLFGDFGKAFVVCHEVSEVVKRFKFRH